MPRPAKTQETVRLNLELSITQKKRIAWIMDKTGAASATEVLRRAVTLYRDLMLMEENDNQFFYRDAKGVESKLVIS